MKKFILLFVTCMLSFGCKWLFDQEPVCPQGCEEMPPLPPMAAPDACAEVKGDAS
jgi:hypothetical protein